MKDDIDIFDNGGHPRDYRCDLRQNAELLNIVFAPATFGNFLKYFVERFSDRTPNLEKDPFTDIGTSHAISDKDYSGLVQRYHPRFINDNPGHKDLPVCLIISSRKKHFLYLKKATWFRGGDHKISPDHLWQKSLKALPSWLRDEMAIDIIKLYGITDKGDVMIPKFIVRDFFKLEFLEPLDETYYYRWYEKFRNHQFFRSQKIFELDLEAFFGWDCFIESTKALDSFFELDIDFGKKSEMKELFEKGITMDVIRSECNKVEDMLTNGTDYDFDGLDVTSEAYIYAEMEKKYDFIQMPLTNDFFRNTKELEQYTNFYPNHYKAMNPNMPKFNGIANPYYLKKDK